MRCQDWCIKYVNRSPVIKVAIDASIIFFSPNFSNKAAMNGPANPKKNKQIPKATEISGRCQPNSFSKGVKKTPEDATTIPATMMEKNVTISINQL